MASHASHPIQSNADGGLPAARAGEGQERPPAERYAEQIRLLNRVLSSITDFAYSFDLDGRFSFINKPLLELWGLTLEEATGKNFFDLKYPEELAAKLQGQIQQVIQTKECVVDETPYTSPSGVPGYYQYIFSPVLGADGSVEAVAGSTRDITERKRLLEAERAARAEAENANRAKDKFLAVLSHELRTPLSPVVMIIPAMELDPELPFKFREDLAMVRRNIELEVKLIDDLLDLSRVTTGKLRLHMQGVEVHEVLRHAIHSSLSDTTGKRLQIIEELRAANDHVTADPARLQQVFWNILRNAVKFTPGGGMVTISTSNPDNDLTRLRVEIKDSGVGIPHEILPRIFDAFEQGDARVTRQFGGLGLGLAIAKAVVEMHGGKISAASGGKEKGAVFWIEFATTLQEAATKSSAPAGQATDHRKLRSSRVLLVEDHPDTARTLARILRSSGFNITTAHSVASALQIAAGGAFDVLVSDIGLPDATGYELMQQMRKLHNIKGIALSGYGMEEDVRRSREAGFSEHLVKPVNIDQLDAVLRRVIDS